MTALLETSDLDKLRKIVGLFDSDNASEANAAFNAAYGLLSRRHVRMTEGLTRVLGSPPAVGKKRRPEPAPASPWQRQLIACLDLLHIFSPWERDFLSGIEGRRRLSPAQQGVLDKLHSLALGYWAWEAHDAA